MFYINRLKLAIVTAPPDTVNTHNQLNKAVQGANATNSIEHRASNTKMYITVRWNCFNTNIYIYC